MNVLYMSAKTDSNLHISAHRHSIHVYMYISMFQLSSGRHVFFKQIQPKRSLVTWLITLLLIICPSSYKARPDNLISPNSFCSGIVSPQRSNAGPNFLTSNVVGGAKFGWHPG